MGIQKRSSHFDFFFLLIRSHLIDGSGQSNNDLMSSGTLIPGVLPHSGLNVSTSSVGGSSSATGSPRLVMINVNFFSLTSSMSCRHWALNSPAAMVRTFGL